MNNEEEILKECDKLFVTLANVHIDGKPMADLLDLYKKEKEKNKEYEKRGYIKGSNATYKILNEYWRNKIKEKKKDNEKKIEQMRPYKDISPFEFGVLQGKDEAYRELIGKEE